MERKKLIRLTVEIDQLNALNSIIGNEVDKSVKEHEISLLESLWQSLTKAYEEDHSSDEVQSLKSQITWLERKVSNLMFQKAIDSELLRLRGHDMEAVAADLLIDPPPVEIHCTENNKGRNYQVRVRNVLAIESKGRIKRIYLLKPVIANEGGPNRSFVETNESLDDLLLKLQRNNLFLMKVSRTYAINMFEYTFAEPGVFNIIAGKKIKIPRGLLAVKTEKIFDSKHYHERLYEIGFYNESRNQYGLNSEKIAELTRYKNSLDITK